MRKVQRTYVRRMPKIYGNLHRQRRDFSGFQRVAKRLVGVVAGLAFLYFIFFSPVFSVRTVEVQGVELTNPSAVESAVPTGANIWRLSKGAISQEIMKDPLVLSVSILRGIPSQVRVVVTEKAPVLAWYSGDSITLIDEQGYGFAQFTSASLPGTDTAAGARIASIPHLIDTKGLPVSTDQQITSRAFVGFVTGVSQHLTNYLPEVALDRVEIAESTSDVTFISKDGLRVQMNSLADAGVQTRNLTRLIRQGKASLTSQVDLRIDRWAYVQ